MKRVLPYVLYGQLFGRQRPRFAFAGSFLAAAIPAALAVTGRDSIVAARLLQRAGVAGAAAGLSEGLAWKPAPHMLGASPSPRPGGGAALSLKQSLPENLF